MKVAVIGGTGKMGKALATRLSKGNQVIIGSRDPAKAAATAKEIPGATGSDYAGAAKQADVVAVALPYEAIGSLSALAGAASGKLVISVVNPLEFESGLMRFSGGKTSAAEELAGLLPGARVATAFNNIPYRMLLEGEMPPIDVLVAADAKETYDEAAKLVSGVPNLRPLYAGPLSQAMIVEMTTALVLNLASLNRTGNLTTRFVSRKG